MASKDYKMEEYRTGPDPEVVAFQVFLLSFILSEMAVIQNGGFLCEETEAMPCDMWYVRGIRAPIFP